MGSELGSLIVKKRWKLCEALQWQQEAIFGEFKSWGEVCNLKEQWRGHLFVTKPDVTAAYTSNTGADWRIVMYTVITHTHSANSHTLYTQWHAPWLCTWAHKQRQSRVNRVQFLWLPSSNNSCSITGPTRQTVPRESEIESWQEWDRADRQGLQESRQQNTVGRWRPKDSFYQHKCIKFPGN